MQSKQEPRDYQDRRVKSYTKHPAFHSTKVFNDFALLHVETEFDLGPTVDTICLPNERDGEFSYKNEGCIAMGWGKDAYRETLDIYFRLIY